MTFESEKTELSNRLNRVPLASAQAVVCELNEDEIFAHNQANFKQTHLAEA